MGRVNILITGTPGVGKSTLAAAIAQQTGLNHINVSELIQRNQLYSEKDEERDCTIFDEDAVVDELEQTMSEGGNIVDFHCSDFFPERGYGPKKVEENVQAEIMQVILDETAESYREEIIQVLENNTADDVESNVTLLCEWIQKHSG